LPRIALGVALLPVVASAAGSDISDFGFSARWQVHLVELALAAACIICLWKMFSLRSAWLLLPALVFGAVGGCFHWGASWLGDPSEWIEVKHVYAGWSARVDTATDPNAYPSSLGRMVKDSGDVLVIETHLNKVERFAQGLLCFNLDKGDSAIRYAKSDATAAKANLIYIHPWEGKGWVDSRADYDFRVSRHGDAYSIAGHIDSVDVTGEYPPIRDPNREFLVPPGYPRYSTGR
jgi:hypothetical protein